MAKTIVFGSFPSVEAFLGKVSSGDGYVITLGEDMPKIEAALLELSELKAINEKLLSDLSAVANDNAANADALSDSVGDLEIRLSEANGRADQLSLEISRLNAELKSALAHQDSVVVAGGSGGTGIVGDVKVVVGGGGNGVDKAVFVSRTGISAI